jgi:PhnB protein
MAVKPIPEGYHTVTPYLIVKGAATALEFYQKALGAKVTLRLDGPGDSVVHAEMKIGDSPVMLGEEYPDMNWVGPATLGGSSVSLMVYVEDADKSFARAIAAGATELKPVEDQFYGDRTGTLKDPFGHVWSLGTHQEDVPVEEMQKRMAKMMEGQCG